MPRRRSGSSWGTVRLRMTVAATALVAVAMIVGSWLLVATVRSSLRSDQRNASHDVVNNALRYLQVEAARGQTIAGDIPSTPGYVVMLLDRDGRIVGGTVVEQFEQALGNLLTALRAAGGKPEHLAALTIYIVDVPDYRAHAREIGQVWKRLAGTDYPATAGIGVARLWDDDALVELQGTAELPDPG